MSDWWEANAKPIVEAVFSHNMTRVQMAVYDAPFAYYRYIAKIYERSPEHVVIETLLIVFIVYVTLIKKSYDPREIQKPFTEEEVDELCAEWEPEPVIKPSEKLAPSKPPLIIENGIGSHVKLSGYHRPVLNMVGFDFLGLGSREEVRQSADSTLRKYGCGSCGPRGFYGTIDTHMYLEEDLAKFLGAPDCIIFADSASTCSSVVSAFAKRGDLVLIDKGVHESLQMGAYLSRSNVLYYEHNDLDDLEKLMIDIRKGDKTARRGSDCQRRYVVTEALFKNYGDITDLRRLLQLCEKYFFRVMLDEGNSIGVLGRTGRGLSEHYGLDPSEIHIIIGSLSTSIASVGGFSSGGQDVVDYQRINSAGYVFSASSPPFISNAARTALGLLQNEPELLDALRSNARYMHRGIKKIPGITTTSDELSPIIHVQLEYGEVKTARTLLEQISEECLLRGIGFVPSKYIERQKFPPPPSLRVTVSAVHTERDLNEALEVLGQVVAKLLPQSTSSKSTGNHMESARKTTSSINNPAFVSSDEEQVRMRRGRRSPGRSIYDTT